MRDGAPVFQVAVEGVSTHCAWRSLSPLSRRQLGEARQGGFESTALRRAVCDEELHLCKPAISFATSLFFCVLDIRRWFLECSLPPSGGCVRTQNHPSDKNISQWAR